MIGIIYNWKGLKEENYLYTDEEMKRFDPDLWFRCVTNKGDFIESLLCPCAWKTWEGVYIDDKDIVTLQQFVEGKWNTDIEEMKTNNPETNYDNWYWENSIKNDLYGFESDTMKKYLALFSK